MSVMSNVSSITNSSVASKKKPAPVKQASIIIPKPDSNEVPVPIPVPVPVTMLNFTTGNSAGGSISDEINLKVAEAEAEAEIEKEFNALLDEVLDAVSHEEVDAVKEKEVEKEVEKVFGTSIPVSATQRTNLSVYDAFKMIDMMLKKEELVIDENGLDNIVTMYLASASSKTKLRIIQMLALEKYTSDDGDRHMLGGAELVKMEKNL